MDLSSRHQIQAGYSVERLTGRHRIAYLFPGYEQYPELAAPYVEWIAEVTTPAGALYAQDDITLTDALRIRLGLRGEMDGAGVRCSPVSPPSTSSPIGWP